MRCNIVMCLPQDVYRLLERDCTHRGLRLCLESSLTEMEQGQL